jgi:hypothetical protein
LEESGVVVPVVIAVTKQIDLVFQTAGTGAQAGHDDMNIRDPTIPDPIHPVDLGTVVLGITVSPVAVEENIGSRARRLIPCLLGRDRNRKQRESAKP